MEQCKNGHVRNSENTYTHPRTGRRSCRVCHRITEHHRVNKSVVNILASRDRVKSWRIANPDKVRQVRSNWLASLRNAILAAKSAGCVRCPESDPVCLDFHHRNPADKSFNIGMTLGSISLKRLRLEIQKCDVLCANCHRKLHASKSLERVA